MEIKKIEKSVFVAFPRMQHRGLEFRHVERGQTRSAFPNALVQGAGHPSAHTRHWSLSS